MCKMCEKLIHIAITNGEFQHTEYLKLSFLEALKILFQNISDVKIGEVKKVQVTERLKGVKSLWGQEEKIPARLCRTPAYKVS